MSETCTSPSSEFWLLDTDSWLHDVRSACWGTWGLGGWEEGGVEGNWWMELWVEELGNAGQMGVNAELVGRVMVLRADEVGEMESVDFAAEWGIVEERVEVWAAVGEVRGLVDGQMDEASVEDDWQADWAVEEEDTKEGGRVEEQCAEDWLIEGGEDEGMTRRGRTGGRWLGELFSVISVSSVLFGILLYEAIQRAMSKYCYIDIILY